jgi:hypothetical protein
MKWEISYIYGIKQVTNNILSIMKVSFITARGDTNMEKKEITVNPMYLIRIGVAA